jgi:hypothetical protein
VWECVIRGTWGCACCAYCCWGLLALFVRLLRRCRFVLDGHRGSDVIVAWKWDSMKGRKQASEMQIAIGYYSSGNRNAGLPPCPTDVLFLHHMRTSPALDMSDGRVSRIDTRTNMWFWIQVASIHACFGVLICGGFGVATSALHGVNLVVESLIIELS